jgi:hypothetical protein
MLAEQIQQRRFNGGDGVDRDPKIERLLAASGRVAIGELRANGGKNVVAGADGLTDDEVTGVFQRLPDFFAAGNFADAGMAGIVGEDDDVPGEERRMRAAQIEQHAVAPGDRNDLNRRDGWRTGETRTNATLNHAFLPAAGPALACRSSP